MRLVFECYAIYSAIICTLLTLALALNLPEEKLEWVARKTINVSFMMYGPVLASVCLFGTKDLEALSHLCTVNGMQHHTNYVNVFVLFSCMIFGLGVTATMVIEKTFDMAQSSFNDETSIIYQLTVYYFQFNQRSRHRRSRESRRERNYYSL